MNWRYLCNKDMYSYEESAFSKMQQNEEQKKEDNPLDSNDKEIQPFYRGYLLNKNGIHADYFRLLKPDLFIYKVFTPRKIADTYHRPTTEFGVMTLSDWLGSVNNELSYTQAEKWRYTGLPDEIESDKIKYESLNARQYGSPHKDMEE